MVKFLRSGKSEKHASSLLRLLAWFFVFLVSESLGMSDVHQEKDSARRPGCTNTDGSLLRDLSRVRVQDQKDGAHHYARGLQLKSSGDKAGAESEFKAALAENRRDGRYVQGLGYLYIEEQRDGELTDLIQNYAKLCGETPIAYDLAGELLFQRKRFDMARVAIAKSLKLDGQNPRMHELLGLTYLSESGAGALSEALSELRRAKEGDPNNPEIRFFYGRILYVKGRYVEAREQFLACLRIQPTYRKAKENLGLCQEALGDFAQAAQSYSAAMQSEETQPAAKHGEAFGYYGAMLARLNKQEEAIQILRKGIAASPKSFVINFELGRVLLASGQAQEAERYLLIAQQLAADYPRTYYLLGQVHKKQGRANDAKRDFAKFERLSKVAEDVGFPVTDREREHK